MELIISKINNEMCIRFKTNEGEKEFDYIEMIDFIYKNQDQQILFNFSTDITEEERNKITELFDEINKKIKMDVTIVPI